MTKQLEEVVERVERLPDVEQDRIAAVILEELEERAAIEAYDNAKASSDEAIPFDQAIEEIERDQAKREAKA